MSDQKLDWAGVVAALARAAAKVGAYLRKLFAPLARRVKQALERLTTRRRLPTPPSAPELPRAEVLRRQRALMQASRPPAPPRARARRVATQSERWRARP